MNINYILNINIFINQLKNITTFYINKLSLPLSSKNKNLLSFYYNITTLNIHHTSTTNHNSIKQQTKLNLQTQHTNNVKPIMKHLQNKFHSQTNVTIKS